MTTSQESVASGVQTPAAVRGKTFQRRVLGGVDAGEVKAYLRLLADQVQAAEKDLEELRAENERLRTDLDGVRAELDEYEGVGDRVNEQVVQLFSRAQLVAEQMVEDVSRDARERIGQARAHEREVVAEAVGAAGEHVRSYAQTAQAQMRSIMESFAAEVERLGSSPEPAEQAAAKHQPRDPLASD